MRVEPDAIVALVYIARAMQGNNLLRTTMPRDVVSCISKYAQEVTGGYVEVQARGTVASERRHHDGNDAVDSLRM